MLLGGAHPSVVLAMGAIALATVWLANRHERAPAVAWILFGLGVYSAFQALPLPSTVLTRVSPESLRIWERALPDQAISWAPISLDPLASWTEAVKWACYAATVGSAAWLARQRGAIPGMLLVFSSGILLVAVWAVHAFVGADALFGVYRPRFLANETLAPILNKNNLAGYLILSLFAGLGIATHREVDRLLWPAIFGIAVLLIGVLLTGSRGGAIACAAGLLLHLAFALRRARRSPVRAAAIAGAACACLLGVALVLREGGADTLRDFREKLGVGRWGLALIGDFFWTGTGRGAFETVFPAYRQGTLTGLSNRVVFTHPENIVVQWLAEWGMPVTLIACGALAVSLFRLLRRKPLSTTEAALGVGMLAVTTQNFIDLGLELIGLGIAFSIVLGTLVARTDSGRERAAERAPRQRFALALTAIAFAASVRFFGTELRAPFQDRDRAHQALRELQQNPAHKQRFFADLREALERRPAEPYFFLVGALGEQSVRGDAMPWLGRALERDPRRGETYVVLARELARRGARVQALEALRHAMSYDGAQAVRARALALTVSQDPREISRAAAPGPDGASFILWLAQAAPFELKWKLVELSAERAPRDREVLTAQGALYAEALRARKPPCDEAGRPQCFTRLRTIVVALEGRLSPSIEAAELRADLLMSEGRTAEAVALLTARCGTVEVRARCARKVLKLAVHSRDKELVTKAAIDYLRVACVAAAECARAEIAVGDGLMTVGAPAEAIAHYERAAETDSAPEVWQKVAHAARAAGLELRAKAATRRAERLATPTLPR
jgi:O-antigen ligase